MKRALCLLLPLCLFAAPVFAGGLRAWDPASKTYCYAAFGAYPSDADGAPRPIIWRVLETGDGGALLLSDRILDTRQLHHINRPYPGWQASDLYAWLNGDFRDRAFTSGEQAALMTLEDGGTVTLPSADDLRSEAFGFADDNSRKLKATEYAMTTGLYEYEYKAYHPVWTRSPSSNHDFAHRTTKLHGKVGYLAVTAKDLGVLPCVRVDLGKLLIKGGSGTLADPFRLVPSGE